MRLLGHRQDREVNDVLVSGPRDDREVGELRSPSEVDGRRALVTPGSLDPGGVVDVDVPVEDGDDDDLGRRRLVLDPLADSPTGTFDVARAVAVVLPAAAGVASRALFSCWRWCGVIAGVVLLVVTMVLTHFASVRIERHGRRAGARPTPGVGSRGS